MDLDLLGDLSKGCSSFHLIISVLNHYYGSSRIVQHRCRAHAEGNTINCPETCDEVKWLLTNLQEGLVGSMFMQFGEWQKTRRNDTSYVWHSCTPQRRVSFWWNATDFQNRAITERYHCGGGSKLVLQRAKNCNLSSLASSWAAQHLLVLLRLVVVDLPRKKNHPSSILDGRATFLLGWLVWSILLREFLLFSQWNASTVMSLTMNVPCTTLQDIKCWRVSSNNELGSGCDVWVADICCCSSGVNARSKSTLFGTFSFYQSQRWILWRSDINILSFMVDHRDGVHYSCWWNCLCCKQYIFFLLAYSFQLHVYIEWVVS